MAKEKTALCFARFVFLTFRGPLASHDSNPYPIRSRIARYNATKLATHARSGGTWVALADVHGTLGGVCGCLRNLRGPMDDRTSLQAAEWRP